MKNITLFNVRQKGFAVLCGRWGGGNVRRCFIGLNGAERQAEQMIGYVAYPNVSLKNEIPDRMFFAYEKLVRQKSLQVFDCVFKLSGRLEQSVTKAEYFGKIKQIKKLLAAGEIYQMCYCVRFRKKFEGEPYALFLKLAEDNPADFSAYLNCGDFQILSFSPERFFKVKNGKITTTPIKGTARKSFQFSIFNFKFEKKNYRGDEELKKLILSEKERAELDMITDLERNDVGKICEYGTLKLKKERAVIELPNLWHTYSEVEGKLCMDVGCEDVITAMFPGGSITGCPKKRAMEYISSLEGFPRNIYTGSIGYIDGKDMDFNIAIRTILIKDGYMEFWAGGGIVADSDPEKEYEEMMLKAERFIDHS